MSVVAAKAANNKKKTNTLGKRMLKHKHIYIILLPAIVYYLVFCYAPMGGLVMAFQRFSITKGILGSEWVGIKHFVSFLSD